MGKKYSVNDIEKKTIERINNLFYGNSNNIEFYLSENDKTPNTDGQIRYKQKSFDIQCKGSQTNGNKKIKSEYLNYINNNNLIYFYCENVFDDKNFGIYYKIFTTKEFIEEKIYSNYKNFNYNVSTTEERTGKKKAKYILFKKYDEKIFLEEIKSLYKASLPSKKIENFTGFFSDNQNTNEEFSLKIRDNGKFGEHELLLLDKIEEEEDKIFKKVMSGENIKIQLNEKNGVGCSKRVTPILFLSWANWFLA